MATQKITYAKKVDRRPNTLPLKNKVVAADLNEIKTVVNNLIDLFDASNFKMVNLVTVESQALYIIPELAGQTVKAVQLGNAVLTPDQYVQADTNFTLIMDPGDITSGMYLNISYSLTPPL